MIPNLQLSTKEEFLLIKKRKRKMVSSKSLSHKNTGVNLKRNGRSKISFTINGCRAKENRQRNDVIIDDSKCQLFNILNDYAKAIVVDDQFPSSLRIAILRAVLVLG